MRTWFFSILFLTLLIRLILFLFTLSKGTEGFLLPDSTGYLQLAENISEKNIYSLESDYPFYPDFFRTPLYPGLLIIIQSTGAGIPGIILFQILAGLITCMVTMKIASILSNGVARIALFSGLLFALDIPSLVMGNFIMTENTFTLLLSLSLLNFIIYIKHNRSKNLVWAAVLLGLSALIRPVIIYFPLLIIAFLFVLTKNNFKALIKNLSYFLIPFILLTGGWALRNYMAHDHFFFSHIGNFNLLYFQASDIYSKKNAIHINEARTILYNEIMREMDEPPDKDPMTFYSRMDKKAREIIFSNPALFLKNFAWGNINFFFRPMRSNLDHAIGARPFHYFEKDYVDEEKTANLLSQKSPFITQVAVFFQCAFSLIVFLGMIAGFIYLYKSQKPVFWFFLLIVLYFMLVSSGPEAEARFRVPLIPAMVTLAAVGIVNLKKKMM